MQYHGDCGCLKLQREKHGRSDHRDTDLREEGNQLTKEGLWGTPHVHKPSVPRSGGGVGEKIPREFRQERKGEGDRDTGKWPLLTAELSPGLPSRLKEPPYSPSLSPSLTHTHTHTLQTRRTVV